MATVGNTTAPGSSYSDYSNHTGAQAGSYFVMPSSGGLITDLHVYCKTYSGSSEAGWLCLWNGSGSLLASASCTVPGSMGWVAATLSSPYFISSNSGIFIGVQVDSTAGVSIYYQSASSPDVVDIGYNTTIPSALANFVQESANGGHNSMGAYADYTPGGAWVWDGSNWNAGECVVWDGSNWNPGALGVQVWDGSNWNTGN
jgi:hypothetical protein